MRFRLSNLTSSTPIRIAHLTAAIRATGAATGPTTDVLTKGKADLTLLPGAEVVTDPVVLPVHAGDDVAVSFAVRGPARLSAHLIGAATGWCTGRGTGDHTTATVSRSFQNASRYGLVVESLEVQAPGPARGVVAIGDSLTDAPLSPDTYQRWTDFAAARTGRPVANAAIAGNRVVLAGGWGQPVLNRFRRDVLDRPGVHTVVIFAGTNDIPGGISARALTARLQELCSQARTDGLRVVLVTLPPAWRRPAAQDAVRRQVNAWIRATRAADARIDADVLLRDPARPSRLLAEYDQGDGLHISARGQAVLGEAAAAVLSG